MFTRESSNRPKVTKTDQEDRKFRYLTGGYGLDFDDFEKLPNKEHLSKDWSSTGTIIKNLHEKGETDYTPELSKVRTSIPVSFYAQFSHKGLPLEDLNNAEDSGLTAGTTSTTEKEYFPDLSQYARARHCGATHQETLHAAALLKPLSPKDRTGAPIPGTTPLDVYAVHRTNKNATHKEFVDAHTRFSQSGSPEGITLDNLSRYAKFRVHGASHNEALEAPRLISDNGLEDKDYTRHLDSGGSHSNFVKTMTKQRKVTTDRDFTDL